ncbi:MAG: Ig-like domain-containing protein [Lachnospiraceae bacterium]|nr:Ig-like domain-containing protein [Lachnospiraceae bacterium]
MATEIGMQYNPFLPQLNVLIDGKQPPEYSRLTQFSNEDIWQWHSEILQVLYSEIRDDFFVVFTGREADADIMCLECEKNEHCLGFTVKQPMVNIPLQKRLGELNQLIKTHGEVRYQRSIIEADFIIPTDLQFCLDDILSIDVNNLFCTTRIQTSASGDSYSHLEDDKNRFLFILSKSLEEGKRASEKYNLKNPIFIIYQGSDNKLKETQTSYIACECDFVNIVSVIFECFLRFPLVSVLRDCIGSISNEALKKKDLLKIVTMDPIIDIKVDKTIEVGKSNVIHVAFDPPSASRPKVKFRVLDSTVARTDDLCVFGLKSGKTQLEAYRYGAKTPFYTCELNVIQRNRIRKIILDDDELILGAGDSRRLRFEYSPVNADNVNSIIWKSSDEKIAVVDSNGNLTARTSGRCKIWCIAENVSAVCYCEVHPYLEKLSVEFLKDGSNEQLILEPMQEYELQVKVYPEDSIDGDYFVSSSDYNIANVIGNRIFAKNPGSATISIANVSGRKHISFIVNVLKPKRSIFKSIFKK